jgi:hypothetical protein
MAMPKVSFSLEGASELGQRLAVAGKVLGPTVMGGAMYREALRIFEESQHLVPVDTGNLRSSGHVTPPVILGSKIEVVIGYGGAAAGYAIFVHEIPPPPEQSPGGRSARHNPPTQYKYLEQPALAAVPGMQERVGADVGLKLKI